MKTIGIIGGIAPPSTVDYYRAIVALYREQKRDGSYPSILINSIDMTKMLGLIEAKDLPVLIDYLSFEIDKLARAGADFGLLASNTPHNVFEQLRQRSAIPLLSIVEATCDAVKALGLNKVGLFGTRFTMQGKFYPDVFSRLGITLVAPEPDDPDYIHDKYMSELVNSVFQEETRQRLLEIIDKMQKKEGIQGLILGGTELPLLLRNPGGIGIPFLDTTKIHVARAVTIMLS